MKTQEKNYTSNPVNRDLSTQFKLVFNVFEKHHPEWCMKLIQEPELEEFHHVLWDLPFYRKVYKVSTKWSFSGRKMVYCQIRDGISNNIELFRMNRWVVTKKWFGKYDVYEDVISLRHDSFEDELEEIITSKYVDINDIPEPIRNKILFRR